MPQDQPSHHRFGALCQRISTQLNVTQHKVESALQLLGDGRTIPFIARYRKEVTGGLDEQQLRIIDDALTEAGHLEDRRTAILKILQTKDVPQDVLDAVRSCDNRSELEQLYQPWRSKRKTRADTARERGLEPLARMLLEQSVSGSRQALLRPFIQPGKGVPDADSALDGACDIVAEQWADSQSLRSWMLERSKHGTLESKVKKGHQDSRSPFANYFDHSERVPRVAAHRILAMLRGAREGILNVSLRLDGDWILPRLERRLITNHRFIFADRLRETVADCYRRLLRPATQAVVLQQLRDKAERESIRVFASNLNEMLMASPAGSRPTIGIDPGFRTGCKVAVVDRLGTFQANKTIYPTPPRNDTKSASTELLNLIQEHNIELIAIGNGTASRETQAFIHSLITKHDLGITCVVVSESGASIYSASEIAVEEYPELDVTVRGAISIAHRLQDPMAELVKLDPATIGVGQYQHDVNQTELRRVLSREVQSCVSRVGVDLNTASKALLAHVSGIGPALADQIIRYRDTHGPFRSRQELLNVPRLGPAAFEQSSGFLRIKNGDNVLDNSAVHPESYPVVQRIANRLNCNTKQLIGGNEVLDALNAQDFISDNCGLATVNDILAELRQPGLDPRKEFREVRFDEKVQSIDDLAVGMELEGVVTNVTGFGAFIDIGVHHDALLHISQMANHFVSDPAAEVSIGEILHVRVTEIDKERKRISLSRKRQNSDDTIS